MRATGDVSSRSGRQSLLNRLAVHDFYFLEGTPSRPQMGWGHGDPFARSSGARSPPPDRDALAPGTSPDREGGLARLEDRIDDAVLDGRLRGEDLVAVDVAAHLLRVLAGGLGDHRLEQLTHAQDLVGL